MQVILIINITRKRDYFFDLEGKILQYIYNDLLIFWLRVPNPDKAKVMIFGGQGLSSKLLDFKLSLLGTWLNQSKTLE